jgi:hypothetical protein
MISLWRNAVAAAVAAAVVLGAIFFPPQIQSVESYGYALAAEGRYDLSSTFTPPVGSTLPNFSRYHPNHPLPHLIAAVLFENSGIPAMSTLRAINLIGAALAICFIFAACYRLTGSMAVSLATIVTLALINVFWVGATSGEVHMLSLGLLCGGLYYLVRFFAAVGTQREFVTATLFLSASMAFHLYAAFVAIPVAAAIACDRRFAHWIRVRFLVIAGLISFSVFLVVYVAGSSIAWGVSSPSGFWQTFSVYSYLQHVRYTGWEWYLVFLKTLLYAFVAADSALTWGFSGVVGIVFVLSGLYYTKSATSRSLKVLLLAWPLTYVLVNVLFRGRADGINGWLFSLPPIMLIMNFAFEKLSKRKETVIYVLLIPMCIGFANFSTVMMPMVSLDRHQKSFLPQPGELIAETKGLTRNVHDIPVVFAVNNPLLSFGEIYEMVWRGYDLKEIVLYCCGKTNSASVMGEALKSKDKFIFITDSVDDRVTPPFANETFAFRNIFDHAGSILKNSIPSSIYYERQPRFPYPKRIRAYLVERKVQPEFGRRW